MTSDREETRKVQKLGTSTLALSLLAEWTRRHGIEKGDSIAIRKNADSLSVLSPAGARGGSEATVRAGELDADTLERIVVAQYVLGRRVVTVEGGREPLADGHTEAVYRAQRRLMGLGVIEETRHRIAIRCSIDPADFTLDRLVGRLEEVARSMRGDAIEAFAEGDADLATRVADRERQADKVFLLLLRLVFSAHRSASVQSAMGLDDGRSLLGYYSVVNNLEEMADDAGTVATAVADDGASGGGVDDDVVCAVRALAGRVDDASSAALRSFVERDFERTLQVRGMLGDVERRRADILAGLAEEPTPGALAVREVLAALDNSAACALQNAEIAMNVALSDDSEFVTVE